MQIRARRGLHNRLAGRLCRVIKAVVEPLGQDIKLAE